MKVVLYLLCCSFIVSCATSTQQLIVGPERLICKGNQSNCYQVKTKDSLAEWDILEGSIEGFDYQPGYTYILEVYKRKDTELEDEDSGYTLKRILQKQKQKNRAPEGSFNVLQFRGEAMETYTITMDFTNQGQVNGKGVCNRYSGTFTTTGSNKIKFSQAATTRMLCKEPALERDFFQTMNAVNRYYLEDNTLELYVDENKVLTASSNIKL